MAHHLAQVALEVFPVGEQLQIADDGPQRLPHAQLGRVVDPVGGPQAVDELGGDGLAPEQVLVGVVGASEHPAGHRVVERLGELGLLVVELEQAHGGGALDGAPHRLVRRGLGELVANDLDALAHARVVAADALSAGLVHGAPVPALEAVLGQRRQGTKAPVVTVEPIDDQRRNSLREVHARQCTPGGDRVPARWNGPCVEFPDGRADRPEWRRLRSCGDRDAAPRPRVRGADLAPGARDQRRADRSKRRRHGRHLHRLPSPARRLARTIQGRASLPPGGRPRRGALARQPHDVEDGGASTCPSAAPRAASSAIRRRSAPASSSASRVASSITFTSSSVPSATSRRPTWARTPR